MGRVKKGVQCSVKGCTQLAKAAGLDVEGRRAYLCEEHYKEFKRRRRRERLVERWRFKPF